MKVIPVLVNQFDDCTGPGQTDKTVEFYRAGSAEPDYTDPNSFGYPLSFRQYASTVAQHYANNETIAWWQLVNEAETPAAAGGCAPDGTSVLRNFADDMTGVIKNVDPNHLVSLGTIGTGQCGASVDEYRFLHEGAVDLCEYHDYHEPELAMPGDVWNGLQVRLDQCSEPTVNKPLFIGEAGIAANVQADGMEQGPITETTLYQRASFFDTKIETQFGAGVAGYLIWNKIADASDSAANAESSPASYGIGPSSLTTDQTESVVRGWSGQFVAEFDWEDGTDENWYMTWGNGVSLSSTTSQSYTRLKSLLLTLWGYAGNTAIARDFIDGETLAPGQELELRVYAPADAPVSIKLFTRDNSWVNHFSDEILLSNGWNTLTFEVPPQPTPLMGVGIELVNPTAWVGSLRLDTVGWPEAAPEPPQTVDFQDGVNGYAGTADTFVASGKANGNYDGGDKLEADGSDKSNGRLVTLIKWDVSQLPAGANVQDANVRFQVSNSSDGTYNLHAMEADWTAGSATWNNTDPTANQGALVGSFSPDDKGFWTVQLNSAGVALVQGWVDGSVANHGLMLIDADTSDGVAIRSSEYGSTGSRPRLSVTSQ